jgi:hypothetical protein
MFYKSCQDHLVTILSLIWMSWHKEKVGWRRSLGFGEVKKLNFSNVLQIMPGSFCDHFELNLSGLGDVRLCPAAIRSEN